MFKILCFDENIYFFKLENLFFRHQRLVRSRGGHVQNGRNGNARGSANQTIRAQGQKRRGTDQEFQHGSQVDYEIVEHYGFRRHRIVDGRLQQVHRNDQDSDGAFRRVHVPAPPALPQGLFEAVDITHRRQACG